MKQYVALKRTIVRDGIKHLPRPKITQEVLLIGDKQACEALIDELVLLPINQSTDQIKVDLLTAKYEGQKTYNSKDMCKDNGKRLLRQRT